MEVKGKQIVIYERVGSDAQGLLDALGFLGETLAYRADALQETLDQIAQFSPEMRFTLQDEDKRLFDAERWCYKGRIDDWIDLSLSGSIEKLARELVPTLGTDAFFELY
jgi:DNA gyrase/topoisomerase IV subunit B